jgi:hypothetical protein
MTEENKYAFLLYVLISLGVVVTLTLISTTKAEAESIVIKNKCAAFTDEAQVGFWDCWDESQGAFEAERLSEYKRIKRAAKSRGYDLRQLKKVVLNDPACTPNRCNYKFHGKQGVAYLPIMSGCGELNMTHGLRAIREAVR